jgi:hypothetical protein
MITSRKRRRDMPKTRLNPLVAQALQLPTKNRKSWLEQLPAKQQSEITAAARLWPETGQPWTNLARVVKEQFKLSQTVRIVADALKQAAQS